ncbi:hypothetical protein Hte_006558 [Hypoxylon texense]
MLQLSSRSAHRIGTSYICASCLAASQPSRLVALHPTSIRSNQSRPLTSTSRRPATSTETSTPADDGSQNARVPEKGVPKRKKEDKRKKNIKKADTPVKAIKKADTPVKAPLSKAASLSEDVHQLQVLQGALQALKNVLASHNIDVDQIGKSTSKIDQAGSGPKAKAKTKAKAKSKPGAKPTKTDSEVASTSQDASGKGDSKKSSKQKDVDKSHEAAVHATPTSSVTPKAKPVNSKSTAGRSRRNAPTVSPRRARSKGPARARPKLSTDRQPTKEPPNNPVLRLRESLRNLSLSDGSASEAPEPRTVSGEVRGNYQIIGQPSSGELSAAREKNWTKNWEKNILAINTISTRGLKVVPIERDRVPVPSLSYGLDRVLFNPGVYYLQDPRSKVYNFDPYLSEIMPIQEFDFNALKQYVTSSKDANLIRIAKEHGKKYTGSTSSMTSMLSHFHYLLSSWREINTSMLSRTFQPDSTRFTEIMRSPAAVFLHWKDGTYAIDADKEFDTANILSMLGKSMEKLLTLTKEEYERYRHINSDQITEEERNAEEAFHYTGFGDFMMRSQLDAYDPRIPGTGMFDLKTRAVVSIRMDATGFQKGLGYEIRQRFGQWESFEREYYDMIRAAFLKYSLQVRMGRMDGIFVAFHNTQRIFGFQYIPLEEMDLALHGTSNKFLGNREYMLSLSLLNDVLDRAAKRFPEQSIRLHFETRTSVAAPFMYIFAKPVTPNDIDEVQNAGKASVEAFEKEMLGIVKAEAEADTESVMENDDAANEDEAMEESSVTQVMSSLAAWKEVRQMVEDAVDDDELGIGAVREAIEDSLEQSGLLHARSSTEARGYVDALLSALTSENSSELVESSLDPPAEEGAPADMDDSLPTSQEKSELESGSPGDEEVVSGNLLGAKQPQIDEGREESTETLGTSDQPKTGDEKDYSKPTAQSEIISDQDGEHAATTESPEYQTRGDDQSVDNAAPDEPVTESSTTASVSEEPSEEAHAKASKVAEEEEGEEEDDEMDEMDDEVEAEGTKKDPNVISTMSPLKDLIVKMARRIDEKDVSEESDSSLDNTSKLKEFERILGELIARSKNEQTPPPESEISLGPNVESRPQAEEETKSAESQSEEAGNAQDPSPQSSSSEASEASKEAANRMRMEEEGDPNLLGMVLTIKNKVNGVYVTRPVDLKRTDNWTVEYNIEEITGNRAYTIYHQCLARRRKVFKDTGERDSQWYKMFRGELQERTESGRRFRAAETAKAKVRPVHVMGRDGALKWDDVFGKQQQQQQDPASQKAEQADDEEPQYENTARDDSGEEGSRRPDKDN